MPVKKTYPQLGPEALGLLRDAVARAGSISAVAHALGYSRPAISLALNGKYTGGTAKLTQAIIQTFRGSCYCPQVEREMPADECRWWRSCPCPTYSNVAARHWVACKTCINNPDRKEPSR